MSGRRGQQARLQRREWLSAWQAAALYPFLTPWVLRSLCRLGLLVQRPKHPGLYLHADLPKTLDALEERRRAAAVALPIKLPDLVATHHQLKSMAAMFRRPQHYDPLCRWVLDGAPLNTLPTEKPR